MQTTGITDVAAARAGGMTHSGLVGLCGRRRECGVLDELVAAVRRGESRVLVVHGEAGIGKTALLEYLVGAASGLSVVRAMGVESEMELAYASLHQICAAMLDRLDRLPGPQRDALEVAFGLSRGSAPDRFLVGLAVLNLLTEVAEERPLVCVVDDAQWLDRASALTLALVARRLIAEHVGLVFGTRVVGDELRGVADLEVRGLRNGDARAVLKMAVGFVLDERVRDQIVAETRGNPLALLELPRGLTAAQLAGGFGLLGAQALPGRIEESFTERLEALPEEARLLLLVAAAEPTGDPVLVSRTAERLGIAARVTAGTEGLLTFGEQVTFRHPLVRSAVYGSAAPERRRTVHLALAEMTDRRLDPDRRAWHLAEAAAGPDEEVASELEHSAGRAQARGGLSATAAFLRRSVVLTADPSRRADRALAAAEAEGQAGAFDVAERLVGIAARSSLDGLQKARLELVRAHLAFASRRGSDAPPLLLKAAKLLESLDVRLARETYLEALSAAMFAGRLAGPGARARDVSHAAGGARRASNPPRLPDLLLDGLAGLFTEGYPCGARVLQPALAGFGGDMSAGEEPRWLWLACVSALHLWDFERWALLSERLVHLAREAGALSELPLALRMRGFVHLFSGELPAARSLVAEARVATEATGSDLTPYCAIGLAALEGREAQATALIDASAADAVRRGEGIALSVTGWAKALLYNGLGRYQQAMAEAQRVSDFPEDLGTSNWGMIELIEAAVRSGRTALAADTYRRLEEMAAATGTNWVIGVAARSRALLIADKAAESSYLDAIDRLSETPLRAELARAHLLYGEWLRRERRRVDARAQLRTAYEMLTAIGMEAFAERARRELVATGETVRKRTVETSDDLTPHETEIARLAHDGLSNQEIGARLFISPRTVEWHLGKVFGKLGISSRRELAKGLGLP